MPEEQIFTKGQKNHQQMQEPVVQNGEQTGELDDLLDEIDELLVSDSQTFVESFVQKGGQ